MPGPAGRTGAASLSGQVGTTLAGSVAGFTDQDPAGALSDYSALIDWGDGQLSQGVVVSQVGGLYTVLGQHTYAENFIGGFKNVANWSFDFLSFT